MSMRFADPDGPAIPLSVVSESGLADWTAGLPEAHAAWVSAIGFKGGVGEACALPGPDGQVAAAAVGYGSAASRARARFHLAAGAARLPEGDYALTTDLGVEAETEALGWLLSHYRFDRYARASGTRARLVAPESIDAAAVLARAKGEALTRDLINTPAADMGPPDLEEAARALAAQFGASVEVTTGDDLLAANFPLIHTVGRAADRAPRLIEMSWGVAGPRLTLVGKGVCFDTGGLNLKPGASMGLMKKDIDRKSVV